MSNVLQMYCKCISNVLQIANLFLCPKIEQIFYRSFEKFWCFYSENKFSVGIQQKSDLHLGDFLLVAAIQNYGAHNLKFGIILLQIHLIESVVPSKFAYPILAKFVFFALYVIASVSFMSSKTKSGIETILSLSPALYAALSVYFASGMWLPSAVMK